MDVDDGYSTAIFFFLSFAIIIVSLQKSEKKQPLLRHIPTLGRQSYILSYVDALRFVYNGTILLQNVYQKYQSGISKLSTLNRWVVIISGKIAIEELRKSTDDELSASLAAKEPDALLYALGHYKAATTKGINTLTRQLTQNIAFLIPAIRAELVRSLDGSITNEEGIAGWQELDAMDLVIEVTTNTINRVFVGHPASLNKEFTISTESLVRDIYDYKHTVLSSSLLPAGFLSNYSKIYKRLQRCMEPLVHERSKYLQDSNFDSYLNKSSDLLSLHLADPSNQFSLEDTSSSLLELGVNILKTFGHLLYHLAAHPKHAAPLRGEIEGIVLHEGWSKNALDKMVKVDSFIKESMRMSNFSSVSSLRKAVKPFTFVDGTHLPEGSFLTIAARARHFDPDFYSSPEDFNGFRFSNMHGDHYSGMGGMPFQLVSTSADFLVWGYGRHACPGRFFVTVLLKLILAHVVLYYDVRFEDGLRPKDVIVGTNCLPNPQAKILIRKRS